MTDDSLARNHAATPPGVDAAYDAIHATIVATERGRWFLDEYANRYRGADTDVVLAALERIEQAIRGGSAAEPAESLRHELAVIVEAISQTRADVFGQHGDPAASGEAAIAEFARAAEQIQDLVLAAQQQDAGLDLGSQLSFQINRLAGAGERLERSMGGLRTALGLLDEIDQRLRQLTDQPGPAGEAAARPSPPAAASRPAAPPTDQHAASPLMEWSLPAAGVGAESSPMSEPPPPERHDLLAGAHLDELPIRPEVARAEPLWDMIVATSEPARDKTATAADPALDVSVTDWAFAPADGSPEPAASTARPLAPIDIAPAPAEPPMSALDRLEAREYGRRRVATAVAPLPPEAAGTRLPPAADLAERPDAGGLDDLVLGAAAAPERHHEREPSADWTVADAPAIPAAELLFDADLFDTEGRGDAAAATGREATAPQDTGPLMADNSANLADAASEPAYAEPAAFMRDMTEGPDDDHQPAPPAHDLPQTWHTPLSALPALPDPEPDSAAIEPQPLEAQPGAAMPSVLQRLESMRTAIAALMDEVSEKTARRTPPR